MGGKAMAKKISALPGDLYLTGQLRMAESLITSCDVVTLNCPAIPSWAAGGNLAKTAAYG